MLRALSGPLAGATFEVGPRVLIGRVAACDVHLVDIEVSREHAMVVTHDRKPTLVDLDSRNGTFMDGTRIRRVPLQPGDTFSVAGSEFIYDRAAPISTTPVLSAHFGLDSSKPPLDDDEQGARATRETMSAGLEDAAADSMEDRKTQRSMSAAKDAPTWPGPAENPRPTVRLEAATTSEPTEKDTVQIRAAQAPKPREIEFASRATASVPAAQGPTQREIEVASRATASVPAAGSSPEPGFPEPPPSFESPPPSFESPPPSFEPPPPSSEPPSLVFEPPPPSFDTPPAPQKSTIKAGTSSSKKGVADAYGADLFADITAYRSFRRRLQHGEMPLGEEVLRMIDLEAALREPVETDTRRDVITKRFFRRFPFVAPLAARFTTDGRTFSAKGTMTNLSAAGLQCSLELGKFVPKPEQLAMLIIEDSRDGVDVRYSVTARVVWSQKRVAGFVFAGVPSWSERRSELDDVDTAVRARPTL